MKMFSHLFEWPFLSFSTQACLCFSTKMICDSYVITSATGVPSPGMSQDALEVVHTLNKTPATTPATTPAKLQGDNNDEEG